MARNGPGETNPLAAAAKKRLLNEMDRQAASYTGNSGGGRKVTKQFESRNKDKTRRGSVGKRKNSTKNNPKNKSKELSDD